MPQARPSLLGPRSTRKVQPVQSSRASFLWLFSSVAIPAEGLAVRGERVMGARGQGTRPGGARPLCESKKSQSAERSGAAAVPGEITHVFLEATTGEGGSTPFWRKAGTSLFTYKSRAWRMRYAQAQFQLVKCASRRGRRRARSTVEYVARKVGRELVKKRAPPGEANCVVVRHTASDGSKGLHLRAIATMAPGTQLTIIPPALISPSRVSFPLSPSAHKEFAVDPWD